MNTPTILVVDDSTTSRAIIRRCFEAAGYAGARFLEAEDGQVALEILADTAPDLITMDLNMPRMDGERFLRIATGYLGVDRTPTICISSVADEFRRDELRALGAGAVIDKPITPEKLRRAMDGLGDDLIPPRPDAGLLTEVPDALW